MYRRAVIASAGTITAASMTAGCITVSRDPGTMDVVINNCLDGDTTGGDGDKTADVQIRQDGGNSVFDETVTVPGMSCSDVTDGVRRDDIFPEAGTYTVAVTVAGYDRSEAQVEFSEREINDNSDNIVITIREDTIEIV